MQGPGGCLRCADFELGLDGSVCAECLDHESHRLTVGIVAKGGDGVDRSAHRSKTKVKIFQVTMRRHCPVNVDTRQKDTSCRPAQSKPLGAGGIPQNCVVTIHPRSVIRRNHNNLARLTLCRKGSGKDAGARRTSRIESVQGPDARRWTPCNGGRRVVGRGQHESANRTGHADFGNHRGRMKMSRFSVLSWIRMGRRGAEQMSGE